MDLQLADQVAVVLGASRGMGRAVAEAFAAEGCPVALVDRDRQTEQVAEELAKELAQRGGEAPAARCYQVDVARESEVFELAEQVLHDFGRVDHVVIAAGCGSGKYGYPFWNLRPSDWAAVWQVNVMGTVHAAHAFAPHLVAHRRGTLLFFSSVAAQIGSQTDPPYSAAKAAVLNFAECAAKDLAAYGVRVNTICPGMVQTDLNRSVWQAWHNACPESKRLDYDAWTAEKIRTIAPLGRWQRAEEVAAMAVFLASPHAANITGQAINVDGGQVMHW